MAAARVNRLRQLITNQAEESDDLMRHLPEMMRVLDAALERLLPCQILDNDDSRYGGFMFPESSYHVEPRASGFILANMMIAYLCRESAHYQSDAVRAAIEAVLLYMKRHQRPSGCFDLSGCNFDSPPDTAFMLNAIMNAWWLLEKRETQATAWLREPVYRLMEHCLEGIAAGGFHTPNHRWAIAACLKHGAKITGRAEFSVRADEYLSEGLDINEDGEFAERSAGNYNQVNDDQMIRLYMATGETKYLEAARANLHMTLCYIDPDDSVFTGNSTRQDNGKKVYLGSYYVLFLLVGHMAGDETLCAMAEYAYQSALRHGETPSGIEWLLLIPEMEAASVPQCLPDDIRRYDRLFARSNIARIRQDDFSCTLMAGRPNFLYFQHESLVMYMVLYDNVCAQRNFEASELTRTDTGYRLSAHADSWYYMPFYPEKPDTSDWWAMNNEQTRKRFHNAALQTDIDVIRQPDGVDVRLHVYGLERVPLRIEMGFSAGCEMRTQGVLLDGQAGQSAALLSGGAQFRGANGGVISLLDSFASHHVMSRSGGAYPQSAEHFTVYMTDYSPADRVIRIRKTPIFPAILGQSDPKI